MAEPRHTYWHKDYWLPHEQDPVTREILPGAIPPGIYYATAEGRVALMRGASERGMSVGADVRADGVGYALSGMAVCVATPAQAAVLQALSTDEPPPREPDPDWSAIMAKVDQLLGKDSSANTPAPPSAQPSRGWNRAQRRAAAARARHACPGAR